MMMSLLILLGWQACAVSPPKGDSGQFTPTDAEVEQYNARVAPEDRIVCRQEKPVGTYIAKRCAAFRSTSMRRHLFTASSCDGC